MNKLAKLVFAASAVVALTASAQETKDIQTATPTSAYVQDARGNTARDPYGLCWHTGYWTPADSVPGCDGPLAQAAPPAPPVPPAPAPVVAAPNAQKVTFAADAFFEFDKDVLKQAGKDKLDDLTSKLVDINLEVIIAVGHTDSIGSVAYNQKLSIRRAEAVKAYLIHKNIESNRVYTEGKGKSQPVANNKTAAGRAKNRRVEIEVVGTTK
ncbi:MAG: OmpA family protein [Glaciimonas sp.]|nr:OmpA family protein [Glaciimonas sp.]